MRRQDQLALEDSPFHIPGLLISLFPRLPISPSRYLPFPVSPRPCVPVSTELAYQMTELCPVFNPREHPRFRHTIPWLIKKQRLDTVVGQMFAGLHSVFQRILDFELFQHAELGLRMPGCVHLNAAGSNVRQGPMKPADDGFGPNSRGYEAQRSVTGQVGENLCGSVHWRDLSGVLIVQGHADQFIHNLGSNLETGMKIVAAEILLGQPGKAIALVCKLYEDGHGVGHNPVNVKCQI